MMQRIRFRKDFYVMQQGARVLPFQFQVPSGISSRTMKALRFDGTIEVEEIPRPARGEEALVRVLLAGICNTDLEITKGYADFRGTLGHEFVGVAEECDDSSLIGKRVVGEINCGCGACKPCLSGDPRHCPARTVLGIVGRDGAMAEFVRLPESNLREVSGSISDEEAVFTEPLAAACEILEQFLITADDRVLVIGDGKLGLLVSQVLQSTNCALTTLGRHAAKLAILVRRGISIVKASDEASLYQFTQSHTDAFDFVIEASGSAKGIGLALSLVRPRGTVVMKSTVHNVLAVHSAQLVVKEARIVGSRCGRFAPALDLLGRAAVDVRSLIHREFPLRQGVEAFHYASQPGVLKVLLNPAR